MKKILCIVFVVVMSLFSSKAQNIYHPWILSTNTNYADFNAPELTFFDRFSNANWMGKHMPTQLKVGRVLNSSLVVGTQLSSIKLEPDKMNAIPVQDTVVSDYFWRLQAQAEYKFANGYLLKENCKIDPYLFLGINLS